MTNVGVRRALWVLSFVCTVVGVVTGWGGIQRVELLGSWNALVIGGMIEAAIGAALGWLSIYI